MALAGGGLAERVVVQATVMPTAGAERCRLPLCTRPG